MFGQFLTLREISILNSDLPIGVRYVPFGDDDGDIFQVRMVPSSVINLASLVNSDPNTPGKEVTVIIIVMACRHIPTMTKSHNGGEISVMIKVGMCQCQIPTIHGKLQL